MRADLVERGAISDGSDPAGYVPPWAEKSPPTTIENEETNHEEEKFHADKANEQAGASGADSTERQAAPDASEAGTHNGGDEPPDGDQQDAHPRP
jgi:hypothetical protein